MSSLNRYKKVGGFSQLLSLIETFGPQKRDKFLEMIESESQVWAQALRAKALSVERIFGWPDQVVIEIIKSLPTKSMAIAIASLEEGQRVRLNAFFTPSDLRRMQDAMVDKPKPEEMTATLVKLIELTRKMLVQGDLRAEKFDEGLIIPEDFEAKLEGHGELVPARKPADAPQATPSHVSVAPERSTGAPDSGEALQLQRTLAAALKENKALKDEVRIMREKLEQIRKIA